MPTATTVETMLHQWGVWSRLDDDVGPAVARAAASLEGGYRSPQCWDETKPPRVVLLPDDQALVIERAVVASGPVYASIIRAYYIRRLPCRNRGERDLLHQAHERIAVLLGTPGCATGASERRRSDAASAGAMSASAESP